MFTCNSNLSIQKFQSCYPNLNSSTQISQKQNVPTMKHELHINLKETQQIHCNFIKTCSCSNNSSYKLHFPALDSYSSNAALYTFLISSYIKNNCPQDAVKIYVHMRQKGAVIDNFIIPSVLKACCLVDSALLGQEVHGFAVKSGFHRDVFVCNALIMMYNEVVNVSSSRLLFDKIERRDSVSWGTMIRNYSRNGMLVEAMDLLREMWVFEVKPSETVIISIIHVIAEFGDLKLGKVMHAYAMRNMNYEKFGVSLSTALIDLYVKCRNLGYARRVFDVLSERSIISWTAIIAAYINFNDLDEGLRLFVEILQKGMYPNEVTILRLVQGCGNAGSLKLGKWLHAFTLRNGFTFSLVLATAFIDMYGKCGDAWSARSIFDSVENKDLMIWSAMISAYAQANCADEAFDVFVQMTEFGIKPNEVTMVSILVLCAKLGSLEMGKWIHSYIDKQGIKEDMILRTSLIDMYAKCGDIDTAHRLFAAATNRDISMWNAMISGFAIHGRGEEALELFAKMEAIGVTPNEITFIGALHACSHAGLLQEGNRLFHRMVHEFVLSPKVEHYGCMVDLLGRAGLLDEAQELIKGMPMRPNVAVLGSFLAACKLHKNVDLGEWAAKQFLSLEPQKCGYNVLMSNIYASTNRWEEVSDIRTAIKDAGISKEPGVSSIEVNGSVHEFTMGNRVHPETQKIYEMAADIRANLCTCTKYSSHTFSFRCF